MAKRRLNRDDWTVEALKAMAGGGPAAVAVDVLAKRLGATRGSFYWHFTDREALLVAALEMWEKLATADMIVELESIHDPRERLRALLFEALRVRPEDAGLEPAIHAHAHDLTVAPVLRRVTERRVGYLTEVYTELGLAPEQARRQAVVAYSAYLGWVVLRAAAPEVCPEVTEDNAALDHLVEQLLPSVQERSASTRSGPAEYKL